MLLILLLQLISETLGAPVFNQGALQVVAQEALSRVGSSPSLDAMAHNLADHRAIAKSVMSHGQVTTGYPILKNSFTPSMAGVEFDQQPVAIDRSPKIADGLTASKKRRISEADSSTSQQSNKLMPNRHTENVMEFGLTKAFDLAFWEELDQWIENARSSLPHEKMLFSEDAALRGTHIRNSLPLYETLMTMPAPIKEWIDGKNPTTIDQDLTAARNDEGLTTEHKVKDPEPTPETERGSLIAEKHRGVNAKSHYAGKSRAEAMGLVNGRVRLVKGSLRRILLKADLPSNAPEMIMNGEVSDATAKLWRDKARKTLYSLPEYEQGRNQRNNYLKSLRQKRIEKVEALGLNVNEVQPASSIPQYLRKLGISTLTLDRMVAKKLSPEEVQVWQARAREALNEMNKLKAQSGKSRLKKSKITVEQD